MSPVPATAKRAYKCSVHGIKCRRLYAPLHSAHLDDAPRQLCYLAGCSHRSSACASEIAVCAPGPTANQLASVENTRQRDSFSQRNSKTGSDRQWDSVSLVLGWVSRLCVWGLGRWMMIGRAAESCRFVYKAYLASDHTCVFKLLRKRRCRSIRRSFGEKESGRSEPSPVLTHQEQQPR